LAIKRPTTLEAAVAETEYLDNWMDKTKHNKATVHAVQGTSSSFKPQKGPRLDIKARTQTAAEEVAKDEDGADRAESTTFRKPQKKWQGNDGRRKNTQGGDNQGQQGRRNFKQKQQTCFFCGTPNHYMRDCRKYKASQENKNARSSEDDQKNE
jgi:Zinc knuckle